MATTANHLMFKNRFSFCSFLMKCEFTDLLYHWTLQPNCDHVKIGPTHHWHRMDFIPVKVVVEGVQNCLSRHFKNMLLSPRWDRVFVWYTAQEQYISWFSVSAYGCRLLEVKAALEFMTLWQQKLELLFYFFSQLTTIFLLQGCSAALCRCCNNVSSI